MTTGRDRILNGGPTTWRWAIMLLATSLCLSEVQSSLAQTGIDFPGTVLMVDPGTGKFAVKKESGGARFTFVANEKTQFEGAGLKSLKDVKKDDKVLVLYQVVGSQYIALKVTRK